jgi:phenylacetate-CoA ligase
MKELRTFGEVLPSELPELARSAWDAALSDIYSCEEVGSIALQCLEHGSYHVQAENLVVEILDERGQSIPLGTPGRVVLSTLHNFAMPLIRYELGDYAAPSGTCRCGRGLPVIGCIMGRSRNLVTLPDGSRHWPYFSIKSWAYDAPVRQMQLVQDSPTHIDVRLIVDRELNESERTRLVGSLRNSFGYPFDVSISYVTEIERGANFKYEDFVSRLEAVP